MIDPAKLKQYFTDPILFLEEQYILPETGKRIRLEQWQKDLIFKPLFYDLLPDGRRKYDFALVGLPKKHGKSTIAAGIGLWSLFAGEKHGEIIVAANDYDQASMIIYNKIKQAVEANPLLQESVWITKRSLEMKATGTVCRPLAHQYETAAGVNPTLVLFDELWGFPSREFYDELTLSPARKNPLNLIVTYAGYDKKSLLGEIYDMGKSGEDPKMYFLWVHDTLASWVTQEYLDGQRRRLPRNSYMRFHENRWSSGIEGGIITQADVDKCLAIPWKMQHGPDITAPFDYVLVTDLGLRHDRTVRMVMHFNPLDGKAYLDSMRIWEGTEKDPVDIGEVERDLYECANRFRVSILVCDPWQMEYIMQRLGKVFNVKPFNFSADSQAMSQALVTMVRAGRVVLYTEPTLIDELLNMMAKQTPKGWRIEHKRDQKNDCVVTLGMGVLELLKGVGEPYTFGDMTIMDRFPAKSIMVGMRAKEF